MFFSTKKLFFSPSSAFYDSTIAYLPTYLPTRLGDFLHFGQLFKAAGNNYFAQISHIFGNSCKGNKIFNFSSEIIFGQLL